jgi:ectoine hydroxylase-related dioxygenase (phytanoyl-CoA dioxygenase family)
MSVHVYHEELMHEYTWGKDQVLLDGDTNLMEHTGFNADGYGIVHLEGHNTFLRTFIEESIHSTISKRISLEKYHLEMTEEEHAKLLHAMPYKRDATPELYRFCKNLEETVSAAVKRPVRVFNNDVWVRICRPTHISDSDYNPCHKDIYLDFYRNTVNIYLPVVGSNEKSSLLLQPGSHRWSESETIVTQGGAYLKEKGKKYSVDAVVASKQPLSMICPNPSIDEMLLFSPYSIHGCSSNSNKEQTRMSLEIRFIEDIPESCEQEKKIQEFMLKREWR